MTMTAEEIVREYREARYPEKQIRILADENSCGVSNIKEILRQAGCELPRERKQKKPEGPVQRFDLKTKTFPKEDEPAMKKDCDPDAPMPVLPAPEGAGEFQDEAPARQVRGTVEQLPEALEDVLEVDADDTVPVSEALPLILRMSAVDVIARLLKDAKKTPEGYSEFTEQVRGVLALVHEVETRSKEI